MAILVTIIDSYRNQRGVIDINHFEYHSTYSFNKCLKIKANDIRMKETFQWLHYFGINDHNVALSTIKVEELCTGYLKVHILDTKILLVDDIGKFNSDTKNNYYNGYLVNGTIMNKNEVLQYHLSTLPDMGCILEPVKDSKPIIDDKADVVKEEVIKPKRLHEMTSEDIAKFKSIIANNKRA